jgi:peptidoglycan/LPS O-acetylase OafA/YrhL
MSSLKYRPEIDGLRAVAVLAVLIYHAGFGFLPGGFMGVDIFFVISGFLITSFIVEDIRSGLFSMIGFWERRARRILPPLFVVISATLIAGWCLFLPFDFVQLGKEMASQSLFGSNILFMLQGGYFDDGDQFKALLHTWSLAVEEQFYLFYPIGMAIFARFFGVRFFYLVLPAAIISFALCIWMSGISDRMAFYALPFRGWELLGGAIIALMPVKPLSRVVREGVSIIGMIMMLAVLFLYEPIYAFPGWVTLFSVLGAMILIWAASTGSTFVGSVLSFRPMVAIGLLSYSLYLWHWPVIIFAKYVPLYEFNNAIASLCLVVSVGLAYLTWKFVEQPIRKKRVLSSRQSIFMTSLAGLFIIAMTGLLIVRFSGFPERFTLDVQMYATSRYDENPHRAKCDQPSLERVQNSDICQTNVDAGNPSFIVWGDSFADAMAPAFYKLSSEYNRNGYVVTGHGCPPVIGAEISMRMRVFDCKENNKAVFDLITREQIQTVYLIGNWNSYLQAGSLPFTEKSWYVDDKNYASFERIELAALQRTIDFFARAGREEYLCCKRCSVYEI